MDESIKQAGLEFLRMVVLSVVAQSISILESGNFDYRVTAVLLGLAILKTTDKFLHKYGTATENKRLETGLTRF